MSIKEQVIQELDVLSEAELERVAEYLAFLKFQARANSMPTLDEPQLAAWYAEFAEEDRELAEEDLGDYFENLVKEDTQ